MIWIDVVSMSLWKTLKIEGNWGSPHRNRSWQPVGRNKWSSDETGVLAKCQTMSMVTTCDDMWRHVTTMSGVFWERYAWIAWVAFSAILNIRLVIAPCSFFPPFWSFKRQGPTCLQHACNMLATRCKQAMQDPRCKNGQGTNDLRFKVDDSQSSNHLEQAHEQTKIQHSSTWNTMVNTCKYYGSNSNRPCAPAGLNKQYQKCSKGEAQRDLGAGKSRQR